MERKGIKKGRKNLKGGEKMKILYSILFTLFIFSCKTKSEEIPEVINVIPENGAQNVPLNTSIELFFNMPMDRRSCEENFRLYCDSIIHKGNFEWAPDNKHMVFHPDSLCPDKEHTIFLSKNAMCDEDMPHQNHCGEHRNMSSDFISKFRTK